MSDEGATRPPLARNPGVLVGGVVVLELVFAVFLFVMAGMAAGASSSNTHRALELAAGAAAVAAVVALFLWVAVRQGGERVTVPVWTARLLPVAAVAVTLVVAASGGVPWLAVPLAFFATTPASVIALVVPQLLASRGDAGTGSPPR